jgi:hypothetical protein
MFTYLWYSNSDVIWSKILSVRASLELQERNPIHLTLQWDPTAPRFQERFNPWVLTVVKCDMETNCDLEVTAIIFLSLFFISHIPVGGWHVLYSEVLWFISSSRRDYRASSSFVSSLLSQGKITKLGHDHFHIFPSRLIACVDPLCL